MNKRNKQLQPTYNNVLNDPMDQVSQLLLKLDGQVYDAVQLLRAGDVMRGIWNPITRAVSNPIAHQLNGVEEL